MTEKNTTRTVEVFFFFYWNINQTLHVSTISLSRTVCYNVCLFIWMQIVMDHMVVSERVICLHACKGGQSQKWTKASSSHANSVLSSAHNNKLSLLLPDDPCFLADSSCLNCSVARIAWLFNWFLIFKFYWLENGCFHKHSSAPRNASKWCSTFRDVIGFRMRCRSRFPSSLSSASSVWSSSAVRLSDQVVRI